MPYRRTAFTNKHIYHVFNKTIDHKIVFNESAVCESFIKVVAYYRSIYSRRHSYSEYLSLESPFKNSFSNKINNANSFQFEVLSYCLMPTHFHFLIRQTKDNGLLKGFSNSLNSFVKHFNTINKRSGPIFLPRFKSTIINTENQLKHVSRYIHLNPYSSQIVKSYDDLLEYPFSSLRQYLQNRSGICDTNYLLSFFSNNPEKYWNFVKNHADYQRSLQEIKHLLKKINFYLATKL